MHPYYNVKKKERVYLFGNILLIVCNPYVEHYIIIIPSYYILACNYTSADWPCLGVISIGWKKSYLLYILVYWGHPKTSKLNITNLMIEASLTIKWYYS